MIEFTIVRKETVSIDNNEFQNELSIAIWDNIADHFKDNTNLQIEAYPEIELLYWKMAKEVVENNLKSLLDEV